MLLSALKELDERGTAYDPYTNLHLNRDKDDALWLSRTRTGKPTIYQNYEELIKTKMAGKRGKELELALRRHFDELEGTWTS